MNEKTKPEKYRYESVIRKGKPRHSKFDSFSVRHPAMPLEKRAKIFSPFDALKGFGEAISEKEFQYTERKCLTEDAMLLLDSQLHAICHSMQEGRVDASVTFFAALGGTDGGNCPQDGTYRTVSGTVLSINEDSRTLRMALEGGCMEIPLDDILCIGDIVKAIGER